MGSGWSGPSTARVLEPEDQDGALVYRSEGGVNLRWELVEEVYVPATSNNKIQIAKTSDPDATYVLTFPDQSQRQFNEYGFTPSSNYPSGVRWVSLRNLHHHLGL